MKNKKLIVFTAAWCGPCKAMKPTIEELDKEGLVAAIYDIEQHKELVKSFEIQAVPTIVIVDSFNNEVERVQGSRSKAALKALLGHNV